MPGTTMTGVFLLGLVSLFTVAPPSAQAAVAEHLVINELATAGATAYDDWVELYNPTEADINLSEWSLQKVTSGGSITRTDLSGTIKAHGYFLVVRDHASTAAALRDSADLLASNFALADDNALYLVHSNTTLNFTVTPLVFVDLVGWGGVTYAEGLAVADDIAAGKSLSRVPDGQDTDNNALDFQILDTPTPKNSGVNETPDQGLAGEVLLTITPNATPVQSITAISASVVFQVNAVGTAFVAFGTDDTYSSATAATTVTANTDTSVTLDNLTCGTEYHYRISATDSIGTDTDVTADAVFTTLPCGLSVDALTMTRASARANNNYATGWEWQLDLTVWDESETELSLGFSTWNGATTLAAAGNMRYSVDNGATWVEIVANDTYPVPGADISQIDTDATTAGRQVTVLVQMKVPAGTLTGTYGASYSIMTE